MRRAALLALLAALAGTPARAADEEQPDVELLRDLDLLRDRDLGRARDGLRRLDVVERLRLLEWLRVLDDAEGRAPVPSAGGGSSPAPRQQGAPR